MDSTTYDRAVYIMRQAGKDGLDPIEQLDKAGLLLTDKREKKFKADLLSEIAFMLESSDLHEWKDLGGAIRSPLDAKNAIAARLRKLSEAAGVVGWRR